MVYNSSKGKIKYKNIGREKAEVCFMKINLFINWLETSKTELLCSRNCHKEPYENNYILAIIPVSRFSFPAKQSPKQMACELLLC